jgi:hypothetical protein
VLKWRDFSRYYLLLQRKETFTLTKNLQCAKSEERLTIWGKVISSWTAGRSFA